MRQLLDASTYSTEQSADPKFRTGLNRSPSKVSGLWLRTEKQHECQERKRTTSAYPGDQLLEDGTVNIGHGISLIAEQASDRKVSPDDRRSTAKEPPEQNEPLNIKHIQRHAIRPVEQPQCESGSEHQTQHLDS